LFKQLQPGIITNREFNYNLSLSLLEVCECCLRSFLSTLPDSEVTQLNDFLQATIRSQDWSPFVMPFVVNFQNNELIEQKRKELEPRIIRMNDLTAERLRQIGLLPENRSSCYESL
jgi:hypothetical protein